MDGKPVNGINQGSDISWPNLEDYTLITVGRVDCEVRMKAEREFKKLLLMCKEINSNK